MLRRALSSLKLVMFCVVLNLSFSATAQTPGSRTLLSVHPQDRVTKFIDEKARRSLPIKLVLIAIQQADRSYVVKANISPVFSAATNVQDLYWASKMAG